MFSLWPCLLSRARRAGQPAGHRRRGAGRRRAARAVPRQAVRPAVAGGGGDRALGWGAGAAALGEGGRVDAWGEGKANTRQAGAGGHVPRPLPCLTCRRPAPLLDPTTHRAQWACAPPPPSCLATWTAPRTGPATWRPCGTCRCVPAWRLVARCQPRWPAAGVCGALCRIVPFEPHMRPPPTPRLPFVARPAEAHGRAVGVCAAAVCAHGGAVVPQGCATLGC